MRVPAGAEGLSAGTAAIPARAAAWGALSSPSPLVPCPFLFPGDRPRCQHPSLALLLGAPAVPRTGQGFPGSPSLRWLLRFQEPGWQRRL